MLKEIPLALNRRELISLLLKCGGFVLSLPLLSFARPRLLNDEFVIVDGWILRADELGQQP